MEGGDRKYRFLIFSIKFSAWTDGFGRIKEPINNPQTHLTKEKNYEKGINWRMGLMIDDFIIH